MVLSKRTSAHVHTVFEVNFSRIEQVRKARKAEYEASGGRMKDLLAAYTDTATPPMRIKKQSPSRRATPIR